MRLTRFLPWIAGVVTGSVVIWATAPRGPGLTPDGMSYLGAAQSFVRTGALRQPFADWNSPDSTTRLEDYPAGYSLVLALSIALGVPAAQAARWVNALSVGAAVGVGVALIESVADVTGALGGVLLLSLLPALTDVSLLALSEPLFVLLVTVTASEMVRHPTRSWSAGLAAAAANLVRYAGVFLVAGVGLWSALQPGPWRLRARRAAVAVIPGVFLHLYWRVIGIAPGGGVNRYAYGGIGEAMGEGWRTGVDWLAPGLAAPVADLVAGALLVLLGTAVWRACRTSNDRRGLLAVTGLLAALYVGTVGFARLYVIPNVPFDSRILLPLLFVLCIGVASVLTTRRALAAVAVWAVLAGVGDARELRNGRTLGLGYETAEWQESAVASWLRAAGQGRTLYTDDPAAIWFITGRPSHLLPAGASPDSVRAFAGLFDAKPSALLSFDVRFSLESVPADSLAVAMHLVPVATFAHGTVWISDPARASRSSHSVPPAIPPAGSRSRRPSS